jgi:hypothetical protein
MQTALFIRYPFSRGCFLPHRFASLPVSEIIVKNRKWFWLTFGAWCFIASVGAWALIFSPFSWESKEISEFSLQVNGSIETHQIRLGSGSVKGTLDALTYQWEQEGWRCETRDVDLAAFMTNVPLEYEKAMASIVQLRVFKGKDSYRILGLLNDPEKDQTYQWIAEIPKAAVRGQNPSQTDFPLKPPVNAINVFTVKSEKMDASLWSFPRQKNTESQFVDIYVSQGFSGHLWARQSYDSVYILRKGSIRLLGIVDQGSKKNMISLVKLNKT